MTKRLVAYLSVLGLIAGLLVIPAAAAQAQVPATVAINDPVNDANYLNDQSLLNAVPPTQDKAAPADASTVADLLNIWYSDTSDTVSVHIQTQVAPPASAASYIYRVFSNPGEGTAAASTLGCLRFFVFMPAATPPAGGYAGPQKAGLLDYCENGKSYTTDAVEGELTVAEGPDGTGIMTVTVPRSYSPKLAPGAVLTTPQASVQHLLGTGTDGDGQPLPATNPPAAPSGNWRRGPQVDNTIIGLDYTITAGGGGPVVTEPPGQTKPKPTPPGKNNPPGNGKKKGCGKGNGKQKGACPKPTTPSGSCAPYAPGKDGAGAATTFVTAAATEAAPVEVAITAPRGIPEAELGHVFQNIQVDASGSETGLYVAYEFPDHEDHDIYLDYASGTEAAHAGGFNPTPVGPLDGTGSGGHSAQGAEFLDGIRTRDCGGYTLDMASFMSQGGQMTLKLWLGEAKNDPAEDKPTSRQLPSTFFKYLMSF